MGEQKNLLLAIVLSIAIIVVFQIFFPQQTMIIPQQEDLQKSETITSIDQTQEVKTSKTKTREEIIKNTEFGMKNGERISIESSSLVGSINFSDNLSVSFLNLSRSIFKPKSATVGKLCLFKDLSIVFSFYNKF